MTTGYKSIPIAGGDTATPKNLQKRIKLITPYLKQNINFLDCGCGGGEYVKIIRNNFAVNALGIEYLAEKVALAKNDRSISNYIQQGDIEILPFPNGFFEVILLNEVLEHVPNENQALAEIYRVLKNNGILIIFSPNRWYPFETHGTFLKNTKIKIPHYIPGIPYIPLPVGYLFLDYWARNYWPYELARIAKHNKFKILKRNYLWQTFENISGHQPFLIKIISPLLRVIANFCEKTPLINKMGASQVLVLRKV
jgi:SAM-dependent methyltransferase